MYVHTSLTRTYFAAVTPVHANGLSRQMVLRKAYSGLCRRVVLRKAISDLFTQVIMGKANVVSVDRWFWKGLQWSL